jgi:hypothetical protein
MLLSSIFVRDASNNIKIKTNFREIFKLSFKYLLKRKHYEYRKVDMFGCDKYILLHALHASS